MLDAGATLVATDSTNGTEYDAPEDNPAAKDYQDFGHTHFHNSLIWGGSLGNVSLLGPERIWGKGLVRSNNGADGKSNKSISRRYACLRLLRPVR